MEPPNAHVYGVKHVLSSTSRMAFSHEHPVTSGRKLVEHFSDVSSLVTGFYLYL